MPPYCCCWPIINEYSLLAGVNPCLPAEYRIITAKYWMLTRIIQDFTLVLFTQTVIVAQLVRALDCGSRGRGFEPHQSPNFFLRDF